MQAVCLLGPEPLGNLLNKERPPFPGELMSPVIPFFPNSDVGGIKVGCLNTPTSVADFRQGFHDHIKKNWPRGKILQVIDIVNCFFCIRPGIRQGFLKIHLYLAAAEFLKITDGIPGLALDGTVKGGRCFGHACVFLLEGLFGLSAVSKIVSPACKYDLCAARKGPVELEEILHGQAGIGLGGHFIKAVKDQQDSSFPEQKQNGLGRYVQLCSLQKMVIDDVFKSKRLLRVFQVDENRHAVFGLVILIFQGYVMDQTL